MSNFTWLYYSLSCTCSNHIHWSSTYFKFTAVSNSFKLKFYVRIWLSWNIIGLLIMSSRSWMYQLFWWLHICKGNNWHISPLKKKVKAGFVLGTIKARSFKLCMIIAFLGFDIVMVGLLTLTLIQGHRCVRNKLQIDCFWFLCFVV